MSESDFISFRGVIDTLASGNDMAMDTTLLNESPDL